MTEVLFVDDDPTMLRALERSLKRSVRGWSGAYVTSGASALAHCERAHVDVIVSDIGMPEMDGMALLSQIRTRYPAITRIILSGEARSEQRSRAVATVHQWVAKPARLAKLAETITLVAAARSLLGVGGGGGGMAAVCGVTCLPTPPETAAKLTAAISDGARMNELVAIVETDIAWTAKLLQVANSAFFGDPECVTSVAAAAGVLGVDRLRELLDSPELRCVDARATSVVARGRHLANAVRSIAAPEIAERVEVAALLHEVGDLIALEDGDGHGGAGTGDGLNSGGGDIPSARLGGALLGTWGLPASIVTAVAYARDPDAAPDPSDPVLRAVSAAYAAMR